MMSEEQRRTVIVVYNRLLEGEKRGWDSLDDSMDYLDYLDDAQLCREAEVVHSYHIKGKARCHLNHPSEECFVAQLLEAVRAILDLHEEANVLHARNKYILQCYLAMNQADMIITD